MVDTVAAAVVSTSPSNGATEVSVSSNIVLTYNEVVAAVASKNIVLTPETSGTAVTIAANGGQVGVAGSVVTINPTSDLVSGQSGQKYTVSVEAGAFEDTSNNAASSLSFSFVVADVTAPILASQSPTDGQANVAKTANVVLTFAERVLPATGNVVLTPQTTGDSVTIAITDMTRVTFVNSVVTINPARNLLCRARRASRTRCLSVPG